MANRRRVEAGDEEEEIVRDEHTFTLHQADQARTDFAIIEDDLEAIRARLARMPTHAFVVRVAIWITLCSTALVVLLTELMRRYL